MSKSRQATGGSAMGGGGPARGKSAKQYSTGGQLSGVSKSAFSSASRGRDNKKK